MPPPYRKACVHCVRSKRRCDLSLPRCFRCRVRALECLYQNNPSIIFSNQLADPGIGAEQGSSLDSGHQAESSDFSVPPFPDYDLDWQEVMENIEFFSVPDQLAPNASPSQSVLAGEIYQERIIYAVKRLRDLPKVFATHGQTSFIHRSLYDNRIPVMIQDAMGVCALYQAKNETTQAMIHQIITQKVHSLLVNHKQPGLSALDQLASVQSLALFQIICLFDGDIRMRADAERIEPTFLDWITQLRLRVQGLDTDCEILCPSSDGNNGQWQSWIFAESVRRTVIIGFTIQGLYCFLKNGWDNSHHEFESLSFFAQKVLWAAHSEYQWRSALITHSPLPLRFSMWDTDITAASPLDIDDLSMLMMVLIKGVDQCSFWVGNENWMSS
ncbi:Zn(II)2Cys6 transcription factor domain-containing protein [Aspergillus glaucus CBS 516.65]|uniref:Zn(2)-C6 fungal-type domain-containing protein n=1 Tax=Aspergillus glaucus CBS 516.65 TaxID=1160497 RepID=A0A1L9V3F0_ASPGL|nr:hypothetical protein ASPGLDRAFT_160754 [Aspergillus glaucus CBS 516.65]OJJ78475.1 hypothetical protein ASPGLDRAFT_160754 [Aspergillus glaucus CBS 516.65]